MDRRQFFARLLTPPIPGEGVLLVGALAGLVGWTATLLVYRNPGAAVAGGLAPTMVALWVLLTGVVVGTMLVYAAPTVRRATVWTVWAVLNGVATGVNLLAVLGLLPAELLRYGFVHPWFAVMGAGYLTTALANPENPRLRRTERAVYALGGLASLGALASLFTGSLRLGAALFVGLCLHVGPMGFDVLLDVYRLSHRG